MPSATAAITAIRDNAGLIQGRVAAGGRSDDRTPTLSGTLSAALAAGETLRIFNGKTLLGTAKVNNRSRTWTYTPVALPRTAGTTYAFRARIADAAGNLGKASAARRFVLATSAPATRAAVVTLALAQPTVTEDGTAKLSYTFARTGPTTAALKVNYIIAGTARLSGTVSDPADYVITGSTSTAATRRVTFAAGSDTATVVIDAIDDSRVEPDETVTLRVTTGAAYTIGTTSAVTGTITNDDPANDDPANQIKESISLQARIGSKGEIDRYFINTEKGSIVSASLTSSSNSLYPLLSLRDQSGSLLKGSVAYDGSDADLGMYDLITGQALLDVHTQTGGIGDYILNIVVTTREELKSEVIRLTNLERQNEGLSPLTRNTLLEQAAQAHVLDMDASNRYLKHTGSNGSLSIDRIKATGYKAGWVDSGDGFLRTIRSENAASGQKSAEAVVKDWMNSPGHRAAIMDPATKEIGVGFEYDQETGATYWIQNFGYPWSPGMRVWF